MGAQKEVPPACRTMTRVISYSKSTKPSTITRPAPARAPCAGGWVSTASVAGGGRSGTFEVHDAVAERAYGDTARAVCVCTSLGEPAASEGSKSYSLCWGVCVCERITVPCREWGRGIRRTGVCSTRFWASLDDVGGAIVSGARDLARASPKCGAKMTVHGTLQGEGGASQAPSLARKAGESCTRRSEHAGYGIAERVCGPGMAWCACRSRAGANAC